MFYNNDVIDRTYALKEQVFYNIPDECSKHCCLLEYFTGNQTKHACFTVSRFTIMM